MSLELIIGLSVLGLLGLGTLLAAVFLRRVVPTNEVHIIQTSRATKSYGKDTASGNSYYEWPAWIPVLGLTKVILPTSVFDLDLKSYEAYDKGRLPFMVDVKAFFRITDSNTAAQRVASFEELHNQLTAIVQGAVRTILASSEIEEIMQGRSKFGDEFTKEVEGQLANWGVSTVKNIELMDIRDAQSSRVIHNIMEKKKSHIEMQSRTVVAENNRMAQIAEIEASREVNLQKQEAEQQVGLRSVEAKRQVELAAESALQNIKEQARTTKEKEMAVLQVEHTKKAEINKSVEIIKGQQAKETAILAADATLETQKRQAEGLLELKRRESEGLTLEGTARANAEAALQLAPVTAQVTLAKEIGGNMGYQNYLISIRRLEADQAVGIEQAKALANADIKVIANTGEPAKGLESVMDAFSSKGGQQLGAMVEGFVNTPTGKQIVNKLGIGV